MTRNTFMNHDPEEDPEDQAWEGPEEVPNQEDESIETIPGLPTLAELRKSGRYTTEALQRKTAT